MISAGSRDLHPSMPLCAFACFDLLHERSGRRRSVRPLSIRLIIAAYSCLLKLCRDQADYHRRFKAEVEAQSHGPARDGRQGDL